MPRLKKLSFGLAPIALAILVAAPTMAAQNLSEPKPVPLWADADKVPLTQGPDDLDIPTLTAYLPAANPTHTAVVIAPGGGYAMLATEKEGVEVARWLNARGVAAFVLKYRLGPKYHYPAQLDDAQRAVRTVRAEANAIGIDPQHIGMWGFSAGGHLTAATGTLFDAGDAASTDPIERASSRPDFLVLAYPVITMDESFTHAGSRLNLLGEHPDPALVDKLSAEKQVTARTPPTFLFATSDDGVVPVKNSVVFYNALLGARVPAEMHLFQHGPHGTGLAQSYPQLKVWPALVATWMRANGWMSAAR